MIKNFLKKIGAALLLSLFLIVSNVQAQNIVTSSGVWYRSGNALLTNPAGLDIGSSTVPMGDIYAGTLTISGFSSSGDINLPDDIWLVVGTGNDASFGFTTADPNSNNPYIGVPTGTATESSTLVVGQEADKAVDLGFFDGETEPGIALINAAANKFADLRLVGSNFAFNTESVSTLFQFLRGVLLGDDIPLTLGSGSDFKVLYETADANSHNAIVVMPEGDATNSTNLIIGDTSIENVDLAAHNGKTEPGIILYKDDASKFMELRWNGTYFTFSSDGSATQFLFSPTLNTNQVIVANDSLLALGTTSVFSIKRNNIFGDNDIRMSLSTDPLVIGNVTSVNTDFGKGVATRPTMYLTSETAYSTATDEYLNWYHDTTRPRYISGKGAMSIGTGTPGSIAESTDDLYVTGEGEFDGPIYADGSIYSTTFYYVAGSQAAGGQGKTTSGTASAVTYFSDDGDELFQFVSGAHRGSNFDMNIQTDPTVLIAADKDPDVSNNNGGLLYHNKSNFVLSTRANVGTGSAPETINNGIYINPSALTSVDTDSYGAKILREINDTGAAGGSDVFTTLITDITATDITGADTVNLVDHRYGGSSKFKVDSSGNAYIADGGGMVIGHDSFLTLGNQHTFQVLGTTPADAGIVIGKFANTATGARIDFLKSRNAAIGSHTIVQDNDVIGSNRYYPDDGVDFATLAMTINGEVDDASPAAGDVGMATVIAQMPGGGGALRETFRIGANADLTLSNGGNDKGQTTAIKKNTETLTFAANPGDATKTTSSLIPDGAILLGITTRVTTTATNCTSVDIGNGVDVDMFGAATAITQNTTTDNSDATAQFAMNPATSAQNVTITANGGNCFDGVWDVTAHYIEVGAATSN